MVRTTSSLHSPAPAVERVAHVQLERILLARHRRDAALGVVGVRLRAVLLGDDGHAPVRRDLQREEQPRDAAAENEKVKLFHFAVSRDNVEWLNRYRVSVTSALQGGNSAMI